MRARGSLLICAQDSASRGGTGIYSATLSEALARRGWRVRVLAFGAGSRVPRMRRRACSPGSVCEIVLPTGGRGRLSAALYVALGLLPAALIATRAQAAIGLGLYWPALLAALAARIARVPLLAVSLLDLADTRAAFAGGLGALRRRLLAAGTLAAQTETAARELEPLAGQRPAVLVNPLPAIEPLPLDGRPRAIFSGRLVHYKGPLVLLDAWERVLEGEPEAHLLILGAAAGFGEPVEDELRRRVARPPLAGSVELGGWVPEAWRRLGEADVFVQPSEREGQSLSMLEACAAGRIVVASRIPPVVELLGDEYPLLFDPGDAAGLAARLREALGDTRIRDLARERTLAAAEPSRGDRVAAELERLLGLGSR